MEDLSIPVAVTATQSLAALPGGAAAPGPRTDHLCLRPFPTGASPQGVPQSPVTGTLLCPLHWNRGLTQRPGTSQSLSMSPTSACLLSLWSPCSSSTKSLWASLSLSGLSPRHKHTQQTRGDSWELKQFVRVHFLHELNGYLQLTWESNQTLKHGFSNQTTHFPKVIGIKLW